MIQAEPTEGGECINHKRVARLMRLHGIVGVTRRKPHWTTRRDPPPRRRPIWWSGRSGRSAPIKLWVADIT